MALINRNSPSTVQLRAVAHQVERFRHEVKVGKHGLVADEPEDAGGEDAGPSPQELLAAALATCTAITMEMYAQRKEWPLEDVEVRVETHYEGPTPRRFDVTLRLPKELSEDQQERLKAIAERCPVHKALRGETDVSIIDRVELI